MVAAKSNSMNFAPCGSFFPTQKNVFQWMLCSSSPIAIRGLISLASKKKDQELFSNILSTSKIKKIPISSFINDAFDFCFINNNWNILIDHIANRKKKDIKNIKPILSVLQYYLAKQSYEKGDLNEANNILKKIMESKIFLPPIVEFYFKLNLKSSKTRMKNILKDYWQYFPHFNILDCVLNNFTNLNILEKVKLLIEVLDGHDNLYLKYLLLGEIKAKAKIWGDSRKDLLKSIEIFPNKKAYLTLITVEENTTYNKAKIKDWLELSKSCSEKLWKCEVCLTVKQEWEIYCKNCNSLFSYSHEGHNSLFKLNSNQFKKNNLLKIA